MYLKTLTHLIPGGVVAAALATFACSAEPAPPLVNELALAEPWTVLSVDQEVRATVDGSADGVDFWLWELASDPGDVVRGPRSTTSYLHVNRHEIGTVAESAGADDEQTPLRASWDYTDRAGDSTGSGSWVFEMGRLLRTRHETEIQFAPGATPVLAIAFWPGADDGITTAMWSSAGHGRPPREGWITVVLPGTQWNESATVAPSNPADVSTSATLNAASVPIVIDGRIDDWAGIPGASLRMTPMQPSASVTDRDATVKVSTDGEWLYVMVMVPGEFFWQPGMHHRTPAIAVAWQNELESDDRMLGSAVRMLRVDFVDPDGVARRWAVGTQLRGAADNQMVHCWASALPGTALPACIRAFLEPIARAPSGAEVRP